MKKSTILQLTSVIFCAFVSTTAVGFDFSVQRKVLPDAADLFGFVYQTISRTFSSFRMEPIAAAAVMAVFCWIYARTMFHKRSNTGFGEYLLCIGLSAIILLYSAIKAEGTVSILWQNGFQLIKAIWFWLGMTWLLLGLLRLLGEVLHNDNDIPALRPMESHPIAFPTIVLCLCWLPHVIVKYPGVLMWDTYQQIKQFTGEYFRVLNHPPFGTLIYGLVYSLGRNLGNVNIAYFAFTLLQVIGFVAVLSYSLFVLQQLGAKRWLRYGTLTLFAISPCYVGWAVVIGKDALFLLLCLLLCVLLLQVISLKSQFWATWKRSTLLCMVLVLLMLTRHNGILIAVPILLLLLVPLFRHGSCRMWRIRGLCCAVLCAILTIGIETAIIQTMHIEEAYLHDTLSLPFQQTARVVKLHDDDIPHEEKVLIDRVLDYDVIGAAYDEDYADAVKDTYRKTASGADRRNYLSVWLRQMARYPIEYVDATLLMNGVMFDIQSNYPMYISLSDAELSDYVYPMSYNDMKLYHRDSLVPLHSAQRALTEWYYRFDDIPIFGLFAEMGFCHIALLFLCYLVWVQKRRRAYLTMIPALVTAVCCLLAPVVYLRYALPMICTLPFWFAGYDIITGKR